MRAGLVDELPVSIAPVLLGAGRRLFEEVGTEPIALERLAVLATGPRTDHRFRVTRSG